MDDEDLLAEMYELEHLDTPRPVSSISFDPMWDFCCEGQGGRCAICSGLTGECMDFEMELFSDRSLEGSEFSKTLEFRPVSQPRYAGEIPEIWHPPIPSDPVADVCVGVVSRTLATSSLVDKLRYAEGHVLGHLMYEVSGLVQGEWSVEALRWYWKLEHLYNWYGLSAEAILLADSCMLLFADPFHQIHCRNKREREARKSGTPNVEVSIVPTCGPQYTRLWKMDFSYIRREED